MELKAEDFTSLNGDVNFKINYINTLEKSDYAENTISGNLSLFKNIGFMESIYGKDFYDFNMEETKKTLKNLRRKNLIHLASEGAMLRKYALYSIHEKKSMATTHPIAKLGRADFKDLLVEVENSNMYLTYDMYKSVLSQLRNWTDKALIVLIWNGVVDKKYFTITNLTRNSFENNYKTLNWYKTDKDGVVTEIITEFEDFEAYIINKAFQETEYIISKSNVKFTQKSAEEGKTQTFLKGSYLFRNFENRKNNRDEPIDPQIITNRFKLIKDALTKPQWRVNNIYLSGIAYRLLKINPQADKSDARNYINNNSQLGVTIDGFADAFEKIIELYNSGR